MTFLIFFPEKIKSFFERRTEISERRNGKNKNPGYFDNIDEKEDILVIKISDTKSNEPRSFDYQRTRKLL